MKTPRLAGLLGLAVISSCGGSDAGSGDSDCSVVLEFDGRTYNQISDPSDRPMKDVPATIGTGTIPGCDDLGEGPDPSSSEAVTVFEEVDPDKAVLVHYGSGRLVLFVEEDLDRADSTALLESFNSQ